MVKKKSTKKNLLKKEPKAPKNMTYEEKVALKTSARPATPVNSRDRNR